MLPDDDSSIEIIDNNNNNEDESKKPDEEDTYKGYHDNDEQNVKEQKVLFSKDNVAIKIFTLEVPLLCDEADIIRTIFEDKEIVKDKFGYKIVEGNKEQRITAGRVQDPRRTYHFFINVQSPVPIAQIKYDKPVYDQPVYVEDDDDDCCVIEHPKDIVPSKNPLENLQEPLSPKSVDSQETYYEPVEKVPVDKKDDQFFSCMEVKNDIKVKEDEKDRAALFAILTDEKTGEDWKRPDGEQIRAENEETKGPNEIEISNFYSQAIPERKVEDELINSDDEQITEKNDEAKDSCEIKISNVHSRYITDQNVEDELMKSDDEQIKSEDEEAKSSNGIAPSRFYSRSTPDPSTPSSRNTVELGDSPILSKRRSQRSTSKSSRDTILAAYGGITIYKENYKCLNSGEYLNDLIVDFYLKYLVNEVLSEDDRKRTHVFSSQFYTRLSKQPVKGSSGEVVISEAERRHLGVQRWTKNVNIFEKDFIIIPIVEHAHWNLAIICYPGLVGMLDDDTESLIRPCILFFDSLYNKGKERIATILRGYLSEEYLAKMGKPKSFSNALLKLRYPKVPHQSNATDCGLYVLQYVEQFFKYPIVDYTISPLDLSEWFKKDVIKQKRKEIADLITKLAKQDNSDKKVEMPELCFTSGRLSSDEEDLDNHSVKKKNPFYTLNKKKRDKRNSEEMFDALREGSSSSSSSDNPKLSMGWVNTKRKKYHSDVLMDIEEENSHHSLDKSDRNDLEDKDDVPLPDVSDCQLSNELSPSSKSSKPKSKNKHKISIIQEDFSGSKSHLLKKSRFFSSNSEDQSVDSIRPKRESKPKPFSRKMEELASQFKEKKKKNELKEKRNSEDAKRKSNVWIDPSVFHNSTDKLSFCNADDDEDGISPSVTYKSFKDLQEHVKRIQQY